jgi:hypothetical protein
MLSELIIDNQISCVDQKATEAVSLRGRCKAILNVAQKLVFRLYYISAAIGHNLALVNLISYNDLLLLSTLAFHYGMPIPFQKYLTS